MLQIIEYESVQLRREDLLLFIIILTEKEKYYRKLQIVKLGSV